MPVARRLAFTLLGASVVAGCASKPSLNQPGAPSPSVGGSAAIMPAPNTAGSPASTGGVSGVVSATTGAIGGAAVAVKDGALRLTGWGTPSKSAKANVEVTADPISLSNKSNKPSTDLHIAMADMQERAGKVEQAKKHYEEALKQNPKNVDALLGLAHLLDRQGKLKEAAEKYQAAAKHHPKDPRVWNDLGLCYSRQKKPNDAVKSLSKAIELDPGKPLYRNNIATVLTDMGRTEEALRHLTVAHGAAVAHYNLGYLLYQKGNKAAAAEQFALAAKANPELVQARQWADQLAAAPGTPEGPPQVSPVAVSLPAANAAAPDSGVPGPATVPNLAVPGAAATTAAANQPIGLRESYLVEHRPPQSGGYDPYYRNQLRQQSAGAAPVSGAAYNPGAAPEFTPTRIATAPRPLPPVESDDGPPATR